MNAAGCGSHRGSIALHARALLLPEVGCALGADALLQRYRPPAGGHGGVNLPFTVLEREGAALTVRGQREHGDGEWQHKSLLQRAHISSMLA